MIAILGATGTIGRSLGRMWAAGRSEPLVLFARNVAALADESWPAHVTLRNLADFHAGAFGLVVNAIGAGDPARVADMGAEILDLTQAWDQRVLATMGRDTRYVFLSSGAIYGAAFERQAAADDKVCLPVNRLQSVAPYAIAKLYAEARHRYARDRAILDVRVFGYADFAIPQTGSSFLADLARCVALRRELVTSPSDMVRDYAGAQELRALIACWLRSGAANMSLDLYTSAPVSKHELLDAAVARYGITVR